MAIPGISLVQSAPVSTINLTADGERTPISAVQTNVPAQPMAQTSFGGFKFTGGNFSNDSGPKFNVGALPISTYPRLDGQPCRIIPISISKGPIQSDEMREGYAQVAKTILGAKIHDPERTEESTIGSTTISTEEAEIIKREIRDVVQRVFPRINLNTDQPVSPNMEYGMNELEKPNAK